MSLKADYLKPSTRWQAFIGTLPFLAFGMARLMSNVEFRYPLRFTAPNLVFYGLALTGLLIGWIRGFPLWSYSYLGWSLVFAWWWTEMIIYRINWGYRIWIPFGVMILIALVWTRSFDPIKKLFRDIWNDWTRLTLAMFAFGGFAGLIYDENHHPQLFWFMLASILTISAGSWLFLRSASLKGRVLAIFGGFAGAVIISWICDATWDFQTYYGRTPTVQPWYESVGDMMAILTFWIAILFWPILIALLHFATRKLPKLRS